MENIFGLIGWFIDFVLHMDKHLPEMVSSIGIWAYLVLFGIIFTETGVVIFPFLPGDSLLFAAGAVSASTSLNIYVLFILLSLAAIIGDTVNYGIGRYLGPKVFTRNSRWLRKEYLDRTVAFYDKHGGKTILLARFIPIIRTFAPFVAGIGKMRYTYFISYNVVGGILWVAIFLSAGYFFGNLPIVQDNFSLVIIMIVVISVLPAVYEFLKEKYRPKPSAAELNKAESNFDELS